jgi:hypothetical protein
VSTRHPVSPSIAVIVIAAVALLGLTGCPTPGAKPVSDTSSPKPNFGPPMTDTRTEAVIQQMEQEYNAAKNSRPTYQHVAEAEKKAKEQAEAEAAKKAEAEKKAAESK